MSKPLNFNKIKKRYLTVTLADEAATTVMIATPSKALLTDIISLQDVLTDVDEAAVSLDTLDQLYDICTEIMNHNKTATKIDKKLLESTLDFEDITLFLSSYMDFVNEAIPAKN